MRCVFLSFTIIKLPVRILLSRKEAHTLCSFSSSSKERNSSERFLPSIVLTSITETYYGLGSRRCPTLKMVLSCLLHFCLSRPFPTFLPQRFSLYISLRSEYLSLSALFRGVRTTFLLCPLVTPYLRSRKKFSISPKY